MFSSLLIANRGEIACRVIATARRLGVRTVAIYSDADAGAQHVVAADQAVRIGTALPRESYLRGERIIEAARATGAEAIHPGYGFLSESPDFAEAVEEAGLTFVGPPSSAIRAMGLKDKAKRLMADAGVPVVPGYQGSDQDARVLAERAQEIGFPLLIKARAGGGGRGMRLVREPGEFTAALASALHEAEAAFGDGGVILEAFIAKARHIEIQVLSDMHGNHLHLFERDCSLQRRHQKLIEEAPAPGMFAVLRETMGDAAVEAARAIGYRGAGTVEFILDRERDQFWFMEMNTRLQVEHPVTEAVTGLDLVELQLRVAAGEPLPFAQKDVRIEGHAIEARVYAEEPEAGFRPATGLLEHLSFPEAVMFTPAPVRVDCGLRPGDRVDTWYDALIAKIIVHAETRDAALRRLTSALGDCRLVGPAHNIDFLIALSGHAAVRSGTHDTRLVERDIDALLFRLPMQDHVVAIAALAAAGLLGERNAEEDPWSSLAGWRHWPVAAERVLLDQGDTCFERRVTALGSNCFRVGNDDDDDIEMSVAFLGGIRFAVETDAVRRPFDVALSNGRVTVFAENRSHVFVIPGFSSGRNSVDNTSDILAAPMPGLLKEVTAVRGQAVRAGEALVVLEAMKMEQVLKAPRDGVVSEVLANEGDQVAEGAILIRLEPADR